MAALSPRKSPDRAVSPRNLRVSPRGPLPLAVVDARAVGSYDTGLGESRARSFTTVEKDIKGYLQRKNPRAVTTQRWIKQWYSVSGDMISFYNSKEDEEAGKAPVGLLELEGAVLQKAKEDKAFQLTTPKKDLTLFTVTDTELFVWMEGLNAIIGALKRRQAGLLEQNRDRQRLVELESRFEETLVGDLSGDAESAVSAYLESRGRAPEKDPSPQGSTLVSPRSVTPLSPRSPAPKSGIPSPLNRSLAMSNPSMDDTLDDVSMIPALHSPRGAATAPMPRLYYNWMFSHNRAVAWFARLTKFEVQEVALHHRRQFIVARGLEVNEAFSLPLLEYITPPSDINPKATSWAVSEAHAVMRFICNSHGPAGIWYPTQLSVRILVDEYLDWHLAVFRRAVHGLWHVILSGLLRSSGSDAADQPMQKVRALVNEALKTLNVRLSTREFIATDEDPTIADVVAAAEVYTLESFGWEVSGYAQIERWRETMQLLDHWAAVNREFIDFVAWLRGSNALSTI